MDARPTLDSVWVLLQSQILQTPVCKFISFQCDVPHYGFIRGRTFVTKHTLWSQHIILSLYTNLLEHGQPVVVEKPIL